MKLPVVDIFSDWWARPNPWAGWYWVILSCKWVKKEFNKWYKLTTNNKMELTWVIIGLEKLKKKSLVNIYTDSQYTINWIEKWWAKVWKANNWMKSNKTKATNADLWEKLLVLVEKHDVTFHWVKWHNWHEENERCDELATIALETFKLIEDKGFKWEEKQINMFSETEKKQDKIKTVLNKHVDKSIKISKAWQKCRKCWTKVEKKVPKKINTKNKSYYYKYYLNCPGCSTNYFVDDAKVMIDKKD